MFKFPYTKSLLLAGVVALSAVSCTSPAKDTALDFYEEIHDVSRLTLAQMTVSKMATIEDLRLAEAKGPQESVEAVVNSLKIGDRVAAYRFNTYLEAYIDLQDITPDDIAVDEERKTVRISLPEIKTEISGRDMGIEEVHYRVTGLRSNIGAKERAALKERMTKALNKEIDGNAEIESRLKEEGEAKIKDFLSELVAARGYTLIID